MAGSSNRDARRAATKEWHAQALRLRIDGWTIRDIAKKFNKAPSTVHEAIESEIDAIPAEDVKRLRQVHGAQLDDVIRGNIGGAKKGDTRAALAVVNAITAKAKLQGLNVREKLDVSGGLSLTLDAHQQLLDRISKMAGRGRKPDDGGSDGGAAAPAG